MDFVREFVAGADGERHRRVRYWSALALLRCVSSSPAAAAATLRNRAAVDTAGDDEEVEALGNQTVLDLNSEDEDMTLDFSPGAASEQDAEATRRTLRAFAQRAEALAGPQDGKLRGDSAGKSLIGGGISADCVLPVRGYRRVCGSAVADSVAESAD